MQTNWDQKKLRGGDGILVGSDATQEWLLPWWWDHYRRHNDFPVVWVDLGLSEKMRDWCRERGELVILRIVDFAAPKEEIAPEYAKAWEAEWGKALWESRNAWFKKPLAFLQTPFARTIWMDSDCEVRGSVTQVFDYAADIGMRKEPWGEVYNSGVVAYKWGLPLLEKWADQVFEANNRYIGDQDLLSQLIADEKVPVKALPDIYNRNRQLPDAGAVILHWHGANGKKVIESQLIREKLSQWDGL